VQKRCVLSLVGGLLLAGCATLPPGPSVMVLPGNGKDFQAFSFDDSVCRQWALQQIGAAPQQAATDAAVTSAAVGTALGAAAGAAVGSAYGSPGTGAAVGSGVGLLGGSAAGANQATGAQWSLQRRYDIAYMQCMYAKGNQIPVPAGAYTPPTSGRRLSSPPPPPRNVPPPPAGSPPPPPPGPVSSPLS
jgi:hypothetical protein